MIAQRNYDSIFVYICLGQRKPSKEICFYNCHTTLACGVNDHCANYGQKLVITVLEESVSPAPAPSNPTTPAPNSAHGISGSGYQLLMAAMVALAFLAV